MTVQARAYAPAENAAARILRLYEERTPTSKALHQRALRSLPGGVNRNIVHVDPHPLFFRSGEGPYLHDEDGNRYIDCIGNYTSMAIGHSHPDVVAAVVAQATKGSAWAGASADEAVLAELICERVPSVERVRFTASGTEATLMAIRAARAFTGRPLVAKFEGGYHGLNDYAMVSMAPALAEAGPADRPRPVAPAGIPDGARDSVVVLPFNDLGAVERILGEVGRDVACILVEPVPGVAGIIAPQDGFLEGLRRLADETGCLLVFDEVISFRLAYGGAQELYGVRPDLTAFGKIIGGGYPVGAVGGRADVMEVFAPSGPSAKVTLSGTFHAGPVTLAAGIATLRAFPREAVERLNAMGAAFSGELRQLLSGCRVPTRLNAVGSLFNLHITDGPVRDYRDGLRADRTLMKQLYLALANEGILLSPRGMGALSTAMTQANIDTVIAGMAAALGKLGLR